MKILNLHGYKGTANNSVYMVLRNFGYDVISPEIDYDNILPKNLLLHITELYDDNACDAVVGTSVGGFFAAQLCVLRKCPTVLINPCLLPFVYLPRLGYNNRNGLLEYCELFKNIVGINEQFVSTIIGENDEVIDSHDFTKRLLLNSRLICVPNGKHSGFTLPLEKIFENDLKDFFNN